MLRALAVVVAALSIAPVVRACQCQASFSACNEAATSDLVFTGTVESVEPLFLSRRNAHPAPTGPQLMALLNGSLEWRMRVRFRVKALFKHEDNDGNDDDDDRGFFEIRTPADDCGIDFQMGETYLVYANSDEASDTFLTSACTRTRRLSDAGDDLAYLFFYRDNPERSARIEGFATTDRMNQMNFDRLHDPAAIHQPVAGVPVELESGSLHRFAQSDAGGRFLFDGLAGGDYRLNSQPLHIEPRSCTRHFLLLPN